MTTLTSGLTGTAYTLEQAAVLARQLERLATSGAHQIAAQFANLEFWLEEVVHVLATIDGYPGRFRQLRDAQTAWVKAHETKISGYCLHCGGACEFGPQSPPAPTRISSEEMDAARRGVRQGCYRLLLRCYRAGLLDEPAIRIACERIGMGVEREDFASSVD